MKEIDYRSKWAVIKAQNNELWNCDLLQHITRNSLLYNQLSYIFIQSVDDSKIRALKNLDFFLKKT
jgi:hypothetical protein